MARKFAAYAVLTGGTLCGGGAVLFFCYFLIVGPITTLRLSLSNAQLFIWDALLSLLFFSVHSILIRRTVRSKISKLVPPHYYPAAFAIVSGIVLFLVMLLWQSSEKVWIQVEDGPAWLLRSISLLAIIGFIRVIIALRPSKVFDPLGRRAIRAYLRNRPPTAIGLVARGPFRYVRHPLYALTLVVIWATPNVSADRVWLNILWTGWIIAGIYLEERDLLAEFGPAYQEYQRTVPMLIPWRWLARLRNVRIRENYS